MFPSRIRTLLLCLWVVLLAVSTAFGYKKVKVFMPQAPEVLLSDVKQIAVLDFRPGAGTGSEAGKFVADKLIEYLLTEDRGIRDIQGGLLGGGVEGITLVQGLSTKCYSIVERSRLESVLTEQSISADGLVDDAQVAEFGKLLGVDVLLTGDVSVSSNDTRKTETRVSLSGNTRNEYTVGCIERKVVVSANLRIIDTETGEILGTRRASRTNSAKYCDGDKHTLASIGDLAGVCASNLAWEFANMISPWYAHGEFELEKIKAKEFKDEAEDAAKAAEDLQIERAYAIYHKLYESDPYNPLFLYNLGVLYEVTGDFEKAKEMYEGAVSLKDDKNFKEAVERIGRRMPLITFCESMGMAIDPYDFESAASDASLLAAKVKVKGDSGERIDVFTEASDGSEVVAKVPGGIQLEVIEESGDFYLVKLLGGKQGYIPKNKTSN